MKRTEVIQRILDKKNTPGTYLEIGVHSGNNFFPIKARQKIAVDPHFTFPARRKIRWAFKNPSNFNARYFEITSDDYFASTKHSCQLDVVFIDGLHAYKQSLVDVNNSLKCLKEGGVIIMHDCSPPNEASAYPADSFDHAASLNLPGWTKEWCGDAWKTICYLRSNRKDLNIFVLDCDYGLGIITRGESTSSLNLSEQDIDKMTYSEFSQNRKELINLKDESYLFEFLKTI